MNCNHQEFFVQENDKKEVKRYQDIITELQNISEEELVKDLIYIFQNIKGKYLIYDFLEGTFTIDPKYHILKGNIAIINTISQFGVHIAKIKEFISNSNFTNSLMIQVFNLLIIRVFVAF